MACAARPMPLRPLTCGHHYTKIRRVQEIALGASKSASLFIEIFGVGELGGGREQAPIFAASEPTRRFMNGALSARAGFRTLSHQSKGIPSHCSQKHEKSP